MLLGTYNILMRVSTPFLQRYLQKRARAGKEDTARAGERCGVAGVPRPIGRLVWFHAASVGESLSLLSLIAQTRKTYPDMHVLVTTGTVTSAKLMAERLPAGSIHQYVPVDHPNWVARFLDYWQPDLALWAESEFWPNLLLAMQERGIPAVLLNARMSVDSFRTWSRVKKTAAKLLSTFDLCLAQNAAEADRLKKLGAKHVKVSANLKYAAVPLPFDQAALENIQAQTGDRPLLLWASTHAGEETMAMRVHQALAPQTPDLLTIIVPRHPARGGEITADITAAGLAVSRRSADDALTPQTQIYIADTLGELGLFYHLCKHVVMGGSFADVGGHNPIEPAQYGDVIFFGPMTYNFLTIMEDFRQAKAVVEVRDEADLIAKLRPVMTTPDVYAAIGTAAATMTGEKASVVDAVMVELMPFLAAVADKKDFPAAKERQAS
jgi:3-deoxy-D-manno-octulosonic-acid transferase